MARPKKPTYEWVPSRNQYRKRIKDSDGKYVALYAQDPDELTLKIKEAQRQIEEAVFRRDNPTVREYAEKWLVMQASHIRPTTLADYTSKVKNYIIAPLGDRYMADITPDDVNMAITKAAEKSASIYRSVQMLYKTIFLSAYKSNIIDRSPCEDLNPRGGKAAKEKTALTGEQVKVLLDAIRGLPPYPFVMICLYAGLRREEVLGLQWDCVFLDDDAPHIMVKRAWHIENNRPVVTEDLKTKASRRTIPIPPQLVECLKEVKAGSNSVHVIANSDGQPLSGTQWQRLWKYISTRTVEERRYYRYKDGVKTEHIVKPELGQAAAHNGKVIYSIDFHVTPHQLRHTYITNLLLAGVDVKTVQALAGHEHARITLDIYAHLTYNQPKDLISKVNKAFENDPK